MKLLTLGLHVPSLGRTRLPLVTFAMAAALVSPVKGYFPWNLHNIYFDSAYIQCRVRVSVRRRLGKRTHMMKVITPTDLNEVFGGYNITMNNKSSPHICSS